MFCIEVSCYTVIAVDSVLTVKDKMMQNVQHLMMYVYISDQFSIISSWKTLQYLLSGMNDVLHTRAVWQLIQWVGLCFIGMFTIYCL